MKEVYMTKRNFKTSIKIFLKNLVTSSICLAASVSSYADSEPFVEYQGELCVDLDQHRSKVDAFLRTHSYYDIDDVRKYCALRYGRSMLVDYKGNFCYDLYHHSLNLSIWRSDMRHIVKADIVRACKE